MKIARTELITALKAKLEELKVDYAKKLKDYEESRTALAEELKKIDLTKIDTHDIAVYGSREKPYMTIPVSAKFVKFDTRRPYDDEIRHLEKAIKLLELSCDKTVNIGARTDIYSRWL